MDRAVSFSYFYGEESEQFSFYRIPKLLITGAQFKTLSTDAKLLYGLLLDRMGLSAKNGWYDEQGRVYIYYTLEEIMADMNCGKDKGVKLLSELDANRGIGLIERVKQGQGRPTRIYVKRFTTKAVPPPPPEPPADLEEPSTRSQDFGFSEVSPSSEVLTSEKPKSGVRKIRSPEVGKTEVSYYSKNYPDSSYLYPSIHPSEPQMDTVLPYGLRRVKSLRTLTTESTAVLMPFRAQEIQDPGGLYYGVNAVSKNLLICDRKRLISPHAFYLGVSGSGKSMAMKSTIANIALATNDDIIIIDAEREYGPLTRALGGEVIEISPHSPHHINPLDIVDGYGDGENPVAMKSEVITSILEQQMGVGMVHGSHKSIIDRCTANIYRPFLHAKGKLPTPLLSDWRKEVLKQSDPEARELALASEIITEGSLNIFAHPTNVDMNSRIVTIDLYEMGEQLRPTALVVTLEAIQNRVASNRRKGKFTWVFIDEVYLYFKYHYSAEILYRAWKRFRKYGAPLTAATQNVEECLKSETARLMFANSEFLLLFNQAATDRQELGKLLHISDTQMGYITGAEAGHGLLRMGGSLVPFLNTIPRDNALYKLMTTTPGEA